MTASNLGIIFGPTLIKPRQADAEVSLSSLVDYPYQALMVELLVRHHQMIFDTPLSPLGDVSPADSDGRPRPSARLNRQEKGQQLSRHSKSLGDIKEVLIWSRCPRDTLSKFQINHFIDLFLIPFTAPAELKGL